MRGGLGPGLRKRERKRKRKPGRRFTSEEVRAARIARRRFPGRSFMSQNPSGSNLRPIERRGLRVLAMAVLVHSDGYVKGAAVEKGYRAAFSHLCDSPIVEIEALEGATKKDMSKIGVKVYRLWGLVRFNFGEW